MQHTTFQLYITVLLALHAKVERLPLDNPKNTEKLLASYFSMFGRLSRLFLQLDGTWQYQWAIVVFDRDTNMAAIPLDPPVAFSEGASIRRLADLEISRAGTVHALEYLAESFRRGKADGQLGVVIMRTFDSASRGRRAVNRCFIRVIDEHAPL